MSFEIGFGGSVSVDISKMRREEIPNRGASMPKITTGGSNADTRLEEKIEGGRAKLTCWGCRHAVKMTNIEGRRYRVNSGQG